MKRIQPYLFMLLAGLSAGVFLYVCRFPVIRFYAEAKFSLFGDARLFPFLLKQIGLAFGCLTALWVGYSFWLSKWSGMSFRTVLRMDAVTYVPLCLLALVALPAPFRFAEQAVTLLQLGHTVMFALAVLGVVYLKIQDYALLGRQRPRSLSEAGDRLAPTWKQVVAIFLASLCVYLIVGLRLFEHLPLGGDEPHYLLMSHSLLHDRDLAILNNYKQADYRSFFPGELYRHVTIGKDQTRYPGHPIGLSLFVLPFYALGGRFGALLFMNVSAALLVVQLYLLAFGVTRSRKFALILWGVCSFTAPLWIYSSQIYPEIPSALCFATAYRLLLFSPSSGTSVLRRYTSGTHVWLIGTTLALLPWLQQRMILAATLLMAYYILSAGIPVKLWNWRRVPFRWILLVPVALFALSGFSLMAYYWALYGNPMPNAPYRSIGWTTLFSWEIFLKQGMLGLWLDQEAGLFMVAPHYVLIVPGLWLLLRRNWRRALGIVVLILSIYVTCAGYIDSWRGGWSPAARYMVVLTPLLLPLLGEALLGLRSLGLRVASVFLVVLSAWWSYIFFRIPARSLMQGIGINSMLEYYRTPIVDPSLYFPSFIIRSNSVYAITALWIVLIFGFAFRYVRIAALPTFGSLRNIRKLAGLYGGGILFLLTLTWVTDKIPGHERAMNDAKNMHVREFLQHLDHVSVLAGLLFARDPAVQFEYVGRPKRGLVDQHEPHFMVSGPFEVYPKGKYAANFSMSVGDTSIVEPVAVLDIVTDRGSRVFVQKVLRGDEFSQAGVPTDIQIPFELFEDAASLETRVFFLDRADVQVESVTVRPDFVDFYYRTGMQKLWAGDEKNALTIFSDVASSDERHVKLLYQLGVLYQERGQWERSVDFFQRAITASPGFADAHYRTGLALQHVGNRQLARTHVERTTQLLPAHLDAWHSLRDVYMHLQLPQPARDAEIAADLLTAWQSAYSVNIANQIEFLGYRAEMIDAGTLRMHYFWKALTPMTNNYVIFVHFSDGNTAFQQDHNPHNRVSDNGEQRHYPTSQWQVGEVIHEQFDITAPSGTFAVTLGVWDPEGTGERLPIFSPLPERGNVKDRIELQKKIVIP